MAALTSNDVITRAFSRTNILAAEEVVNASDSVDALTELNLMMAGFQAMGINYAHTDLLATDTVNVPDQMLDSLIWMFADILANNYGMPLDPSDMKRIDAAKGALQAYYYVPQRAVIDAAVRSRRIGRFDFTRG